MELSLRDLEKHSILFIGSQVALTSENPGPIVIDINSLTKEEAYQILFNIKKGILRTEDSLQFLEKKVDFKVEVKPKIVAPVTSIQEVSPRKKNAQLRKLLAKKIVVVKKEAADLSVADLRELIKLEQSSKNRKRLVPFLSELYSTHIDQVAIKLESLTENSEKNELTAQTFLDDLPDVIESEKIEVDVPLSD